MSCPGPLLELELLPKLPFIPLTFWRTLIQPSKSHSDPTASGKQAILDMLTP